jgi:hypothetical protein
LLPLFLQLLRDDVPEVRLNIIGKLALVNKGRLLKPGCSTGFRDGLQQDVLADERKKLNWPS